jgi:hypothetical protein
MCSYNSINGEPACANSWLLQEVARDAWGFDGYITSDCGAENDVFANHHFTGTPEESVKKILDAGTDSDCGGFIGKYAPSALNKSLITEHDLDKRLHTLFRVRMRLGHFDQKGPLDLIPPSVICSEHAKTIARDAVAQSTALLANKGATLPLSPSATKSVAVIGPSAKQPWSITSYYGPSNTCDAKYWTMVDAVQQHVNNTVYAAGLPSTLSTNTSGIAAAAELAKEKDAVVLCLGTDLASAHEEMDAHNISMPDGQLALVKAVAAAASNPIVVVLLTAVPLDISALLAMDTVGAIIHAGQPSVQTLGIGDVIFGKKSPAGRLIQTIYPAAYADKVSIFDFNMRPGPSLFPRPDCKVKGNCTMGTNPGRTYRFYTDTPVLPFGFGLSYTTWTYSLDHTRLPTTVGLAAIPPLLSTSKQGFINIAEMEAAGPATKFTVNVTNTGTVDADDVVLGFITPPGAGENGVPLKQLFGFERVHVKAGETVRVDLYPALTDFTQVNTQGVREMHPGAYTLSVGMQETEVHGMGFVEHHFKAR